jgi:hypothetical protein
LTNSGMREPVVWRGKHTLERLDRPFRIKVRWAGKKYWDAFIYALYVSGQERAQC